MGALDRVVAGRCDAGAVAVLQVVEPLPGEGLDRLFTGMPRKEPQGVDGDVGVVRAKAAVTGRGDDVGTRRSASAASTDSVRGTRVARGDVAGVGEELQVPTDRRRGEVETLGERHRSDRTEEQDVGQDSVAGRRVGDRLVLHTHGRIGRSA